MRLTKPILGLAALVPMVLIVRSELRSGLRSGRTMYVAKFFKPVVKWAANRALVGRNRSRHRPEEGRFTRADVDDITEQTWQNFEQLAPDIPPGQTVGNRMMLLLAGVTAAFFEAFEV